MNEVHNPEKSDISARILEAAKKEEEYKKQHAGHENMHFLMILILFISIFGVQLGVLYWKKRHYKSYQFVSLAGLWLFPAIFFYFYTSERTFTSVWFIFSAMNSWIIYRASRSPLHHLTPRLVYKWFQVTHNISYIVGVLGYVAMMLFVFLVPPPDSPESSEASETVLSLPLLFLCYGLYFGVLSRDFAELCSDRMASTLGYYVKDGIPVKQLSNNVCAICNWYLKEDNNGAHNHDQSSTPNTLDDTVYRLECGHEFHEKCIRGWCLIGKKDMCPYCHEKVALKELSRNPWDTQQIFYLNMLDWIRYLVVWQPLILFLVQGSYYIFDLK